MLIDISLENEDDMKVGKKWEYLFPLGPNLKKMLEQIIQEKEKGSKLIYSNTRREQIPGSRNKEGTEGIVAV